MKLTSSIDLNLSNKLKKKSYFNKFFLARARDDIAQQIRDLRNRRDLTQGEFAERAEMKQSAVSRIEQADYAGWNFKTLIRVAEALETRLLIQFIPMEDVIKEYEQREHWQNNELTIFKELSAQNKLPALTESTTLVEAIQRQAHETPNSISGQGNLAFPNEYAAAANSGLPTARRSEKPLSLR